MRAKELSVTRSIGALVRKKDLPEIRVVAGLLFKGGRLLVCQRRPDGAFPLKWELPGGKLEKGESWSGALHRELKEELAIETELVKEIYETTHIYPDNYKVKLKVFEVLRFGGVPQNCVFHAIQWATIAELKCLDFLEADLPLIRKLTGQAK